MKKRFWVLAGLCVSLLLLGRPSFLLGKTPPLKNFEHPRLVETTELAGIVNHPGVRIVDMRTSLSEYLSGHLPNSVYLSLGNLQLPRSGIPAQSPDRICLERLIGDALSLSNDMWVVIYSEKSNSNATFLAWSLDFLGFKKVGLLNGGWEKWASEKLPVTQGYPSLVPKKFFAKVIRGTPGEAIAEMKWMKDRLAAKNLIIIDGRSPKYYSGEEGEEIRRGHIPGARNIPWDTALEGDDIRVWKKREDLEKLFSEAGVTKDKEIIVYSRAGREASHLYFTLKYVLAYPRVRLYRGSWVEWSADKNAPVKTGTDP